MWVHSAMMPESPFIVCNTADGWQFICFDRPAGDSATSPSSNQCEDVEEQMIGHVCCRRRPEAMSWQRVSQSRGRCTSCSLCVTVTILWCSEDEELKDDTRWCDGDVQMFQLCVIARSLSCRGLWARLEAAFCINRRLVMFNPNSSHHLYFSCSPNRLREELKSLVVVIRR